MEHADALVSALKIGGWNEDRTLLDRFRSYHDLLLKVNKKTNLISRGDEKHIVKRHFLPSVGILKAINLSPGCRIMDLGSGAGLPGIPMKIVRPDLDITLVDSKRRRTAFLKVVVRELSLEGIQVIHSRVEELPEVSGGIQCVVSRAVADTLKLAGWSRPFLAGNHGMLVTIKGDDADIEVKSLYEHIGDLQIRDVEQYPFDPFTELAPLRRSSLIVVRW